MIVGRRDDDNWWHGERKERERQVPDTGHWGLQRASHGTRRATPCSCHSEMWSGHQTIMTVGPMRTCCQPRSVSCVLFHKSALSGQQSGDYFLYWKLDFTWSSSVSHGGRKYNTHRNRRWQACTLLISNLRWLFSSYGWFSMRRNKYCEMLRSKDLQQFNNLLQ